MLTSVVLLSLPFSEGPKLPRKKNSVPMYDHVGNEVGVWILQQRSRGLVVTNSDVKRAALRIAALHNHPEFKASDGWITRMKKKNRLGYRKSTHTSLKMEETDEDKVTWLKVSIKWLIDWLPV